MLFFLSFLNIFIGREFISPEFFSEYSDLKLVS